MSGMKCPLFESITPVEVAERRELLEGRPVADRGGVVRDDGLGVSAQSRQLGQEARADLLLRRALKSDELSAIRVYGPGLAEAALQVEHEARVGVHERRELWSIEAALGERHARWIRRDAQAQAPEISALQAVCRDARQVEQAVMQVDVLHDRGDPAGGADGADGDQRHARDLAVQRAPVLKAGVIPVLFSVIRGDDQGRVGPARAGLQPGHQPKRRRARRPEGCRRREAP